MSAHRSLGSIVKGALRAAFNFATMGFAGAAIYYGARYLAGRNAAPRVVNFGGGLFGNQQNSGPKWVWNRRTRK